MKIQVLVTYKATYDVEVSKEEYEAYQQASKFERAEDWVVVEKFDATVMRAAVRFVEGNENIHIEDLEWLTPKEEE